MGLFGKGRKEKARRHGTTIIAEGTRITGELNLDGKLHVDGAVQGTIICRGDVSIGQSGYFEGTIDAERLLVSGQVQGHVRCQSLEIVATGHVYGEVAAERFAIEPGGEFVGESSRCGAVAEQLLLGTDVETAESPAEPDADAAPTAKVARIR